MNPYVLGGTLSGIGQGLDRGVGTIVARRREERERQRQAEKDARDQERLRLEDRRVDVQEQRAQSQHDAAMRAYERQMLDMDLDFTGKGGMIMPTEQQSPIAVPSPSLNGTGHIGFIVGTSTASTQPSEHQGIVYDEVGRSKGKRYLLPQDRLTPQERLKEQGRKRRSANAASAFPNLKLTPGQLAALDDPEQGDQLWQTYANQNFELDPANVANKAKIAGASAQARYPFVNHGGGNDGLTPAQIAAQNRADRSATVSQARSNEAQARSEVFRDPPDRTKYGFEASVGWPEGPKGQPSPDSVRYESDNRAYQRNKDSARFRAAMAGFTADSATSGLQGVPAAAARQRAAQQAYEEVLRDPNASAEDKAEALSIYRRIEAETFAGLRDTGAKFTTKQVTVTRPKVEAPRR